MLDEKQREENEAGLARFRKETLKRSLGETLRLMMLLVMGGVLVGAKDLLREPILEMGGEPLYRVYSTGIWVLAVVSVCLFFVKRGLGEAEN